MTKKLTISPMWLFLILALLCFVVVFSTQNDFYFILTLLIGIASLFFWAVWIVHIFWNWYTEETPKVISRVCTSCGKRNEPDNRFCFQCGAAL